MSADLYTDLDFVPDTDIGRAFREAMKGRSYGYSAASSAWGWFQEGWESKPCEDADPPEDMPELRTKVWEV